MKMEMIPNNEDDKPDTRHPIPICFTSWCVRFAKNCVTSVWHYLIEV